MSEEKDVKDQVAAPVDGEGEVKWERWQKKRTFVRALEGKYSEIWKELLQQPRIIHSADIPYKGGPRLFGSKAINPQNSRILQAFETHIESLGPGSFGQRHGHVNSAVFFILEGRGHDVHNGVHYPWAAGDAAIVENSCVHQHINDDPDHEARILVIKAKPSFIFMHMHFQQNVIYPPTDPIPGHEDFIPDPHGTYPGFEG